MELSTVNCPKCGTPVEISAALSKEIEARLAIEYNDRLRVQQADADKRADEMRRSHAKDLEKLSAEISKAANAKAREQIETKLKALDEQLSEQSKELDQARKKELEFMKLKRDLEKRATEAELVAARKLEADGKKMVEEATKATVEQFELRIKQKEVETESLRKQVQEMDRKLTQGSQQSQGEAQERSIEELLAAEFPDDEILPVKSGARGADVIQTVRTPGGVSCGSILWESKAAKNWSDGWVGKLKQDQREEGADVAVLVSRALPEGVQAFGMFDGVWVASLASAISFGAVLRQGVIQIHRANAAHVGRADKKEMLYAFVQSPAFLQEVQAIADSLVEMRSELDSERRAIQKQWKAREKQIERAVVGLVNVYGSMKGLLGAALPPINHLELPAGDSGPSRSEK